MKSALHFPLWFLLLAFGCATVSAKERVFVLTDISNEPDDFKQANHNPVGALNGDLSKRIVEFTGKPGETITLSAKGSTDPDGNALNSQWMIYSEAGTFRGEAKLTATQGEETQLTLPNLGRRSPESPTLHVILTIEDDGEQSLVAYRRAVVKIKP